MKTLSILLMLGCSGGKAPTETPTDPTTTATQEIGPAGGAVESVDGVLTVEIPAGALTEPTAVSIEISEDPALPTGHVGPAYHVQPEGLVFAEPVRLSIDWSGFDLGGSDGGDLTLATYANGTWTSVVGGWNDGTRVGAVIPHFSYWATLPHPSDNPLYDPCECDTVAFETCCKQWPEAWVPETNNPDQCTCVGGVGQPFDTYAFLDCVEVEGGEEWGGCTSFERDCCQAMDGFLTSAGGECYCSWAYACGDLPGMTPCDVAAQQHDELVQCLAESAVCSKDETTCERYTSGQNHLECTDTCTDVWSDPLNCGGCGESCAGGETCEGGQCGCSAGTTGCPTGCTDLQWDRDNCGGCGIGCEGAEFCIEGSCTTTVDCAQATLQEAEPNDSSTDANPVPLSVFAEACGTAAVLGSSVCPQMDWVRFELPDVPSVTLTHWSAGDNGIGQFTLYEDTASGPVSLGSGTLIDPYTWEIQLTPAAGTTYLAESCGSEAWFLTVTVDP